MRQCVVFSTPGLIPIEAFTTFGMNAKPNSTNPFGYFGTGLKIAIAVCLRFQQEVVIWRGKDKYTFYTKKEDFRGKEFQKVRMKLERSWLTWNQRLGDWVMAKPSYHELPFTTELGKHWELWQAFREFQTNTMDENGFTSLEYWDNNSGHVHTDRSLILVYGQKFLDEYHDRNRNFLPDGLTVRQSDERLQVLDRPSKHVYYRGVRVWDLKEESQYTYNFLCHVDLTEDRTAKYPFILESYIAEHIMQSDDREFLIKTVAAPKERSFERRLSYSYVSVSPSDNFVQLARQSPNPGAREQVTVAEAAVSSTRIIIVVPKSSVTEDELQELKNAVALIWGDGEVEKQGDH